MKQFFIMIALGSMLLLSACQQRKPFDWNGANYGVPYREDALPKW